MLVEKKSRPLEEKVSSWMSITISVSILNLQHVSSARWTFEIQNAIQIAKHMETINQLRADLEKTTAQVRAQDEELNQLRLTYAKITAYFQWNIQVVASIFGFCVLNLGLTF